MIRIGPAGWSYPDWKGIVYPSGVGRSFDQLAYLASFFDTIEINNSFYRPTEPRIAEDWTRRIQQNPEFRFTAKLFRRFTHQRDSAWTRAEVDESRAGLDVLRDAGRLGAVLLQFPWSFRRTDENTAWLEDLIGAFHDLPLVVEVRHASWNSGEFMDELRGRSVGFVNLDQPLFRDSIGPSARVTAAVGYIRVHGRNYREWWKKSTTAAARYDYLYTAAELTPWAERAAEIEADPSTEDVFVVTNNHYRGKAVANAVMLRSMTEKRRVEAPPELVQEYPDALGRFVKRRRSGGRKAG